MFYHGTVYASFPHGVESNSAGSNNTFAGFTVDEWAAYVRKKSAIASSVAKLNGVLKTKLAALRSSGELIVGCPPGNTTGGIETNIAQCMADAWSGPGRKLQHAAEDADRELLPLTR